MYYPLVYPIVLLIAALLSGGPASQIGEANQPVVLPTVTPTPGEAASPTPTHSVLYWPAVGPELYPMVEPKSYDEITKRGISYPVRTNAGFGLFPFNDISPCLCQSLQDADACREEIEHYQLNATQAGVVHMEPCLSIELSDDRLITFNDVRDTTRTAVYAYQKSFPEINHHLVRVGYWEGNEYLLVNGDSGDATVISAPPVFSPANRRFAIPFFPSFGSTWTILQIWSFEERIPRFEAGWRIEGLREGHSDLQSVLSWWSADNFHLHWPTQVPQLELAAVTVALEPEGWKVYLYDKPITQPIVEYRSIDFAFRPFDRDDLDSLEVGKPVYTDRDYLFTSVPNELEGAIYFRIPQFYSLGEEPDYFSLEMQQADYLTFQVTDDASVYVALDAQLSEAPDWMASGWQRVEMRLETDDVPLQPYRKEYPKGATVELVDRWMLEDRRPSQFVVIVTPNLK